MKTQKLIAVKLADLTPSLTNPRKTITNGPDWPEFVNSIRTHGVKQPPLVRPYPANRPSKNPALWEIVAGERRFTAAKECKLETINVLVEELTDAEAVEIQQIENLQRADLTPLEEAQGFADWRDSLLKACPAKTVEEAVAHIAQKIDRKRTAVFGKLALLKVAPVVRAALAKGELDASKAGLIAQVPAAADQETLLHAATGEGDVAAMSYRDLKEEIEKNYRITLVGAPFKTSEVYKGPKEMFADTCTVCPHRSGNIPDAAGSPNICTNPACFRLKCDAVAGAASKTCAAVWDEKMWKKNRYNREYLRADEQNYSDPERRTWEKILGEHAPAPIMALGREYKDNSDTEELTLLRYFKAAEVSKLIKDHKLIKERKEKEYKPTAADLQRQKENEERNALRAAKEKGLADGTRAMMSALAQEFPTKLMGTQVKLWQKLAKVAVLGASSLDEAMFKGRNLPMDEEDDDKNVATLFGYIDQQPSEPNLIGLVVELLAERLYSWAEDGGELARAQRLCGIDWQKSIAKASPKVAAKMAKLAKVKAEITANAKARWAKVKANATKSKPAKKAVKKGK